MPPSRNRPTPIAELADDLTLAPLLVADPRLVEALLDRVFGPGRHARTAYKVRSGTAWLESLSFAAVDEAQHLLGSVQSWPIALTDAEGKAHPMIMIGPVAVDPGHQGVGIGRALMASIFSALRPEAALPLVLIGDPDYYGRLFGFQQAPAQWQAPGPVEPGRLMVLCADTAALPQSGMLGPYGIR